MAPLRRLAPQTTSPSERLSRQQVRALEALLRHPQDFPAYHAAAFTPAPPPAATPAPPPAAAAALPPAVVAAARASPLVVGSPLAAAASPLYVSPAPRLGHTVCRRR